MTLFQGHFAMAPDENAKTNLPFSIGGVTQNGKHNPPHNNQDAMAIYTDSQIIIGVVSDGCAGPSPIGENDYSFNEMGAQLSCLVTVNAIRDTLTKDSKLDQEFVDKVNNALLKSLITFSQFAGKKPIERKHVLLEFFTATLLTVVITKTQYIIFTAGDGIIGINNKLHILDDQSGIYPTHDVLAMLNFIEPRSEKAMRIFEFGDTKNLQNVMLASDGIEDLIDSKSDEINILLKSKPLKKCDPGYDPVFDREFRKKVVFPLDSKIKSKLHDDRTLILVRRLQENNLIDEQIQIQDNQISTSLSDEPMPKPLQQATDSNKTNENMQVNPMEPVSGQEPQDKEDIE